MMESLIESLEGMKDIGMRIRAVERTILEISSADDKSEKRENANTNLIRMIDDVHSVIEDVEMKINQLDIRLSAIERMSNE